MNRLLMWATTIGATVCALIAPGLAQEHIPVPLADASRPVTMNVHLMGGSITVRAYNGREVLVEAKSKVEDTKEKTHEGMHRIGGTGTDISIESDNNKVSISSHMGRPTDIVVQTPVNTSLNVRTLHGGGITIEGINGDVEAQALNGPVVVRNVSGTVVANSLNGGVTVVLKSVKAGSPMSLRP